MSKIKIANRQLWFILFMLRSNIIFAFLPVLTSSADTLEDAWISAIIVLFGSEIVVLLISLLDIKFPNQTIIEYSQKLLGRIPGKLLTLSFLWLFLQLSVVALRIYGEVIITAFLPETPLLFITGVMVLGVTICIYQGFEVLARMADVLFILYIVMVFLIVLIPIPDFVFANVEPILGRGWMPVLKGTLTPIALMVQIWVITMISPVTVAPQKTIRTSLISIGVSLIMLIIVSFITIGTLGPFEADRAVFPVLSLIRSVQISKFLQRTEVLIIFSWGLGLFTTVATYLYCGAKGLAQWLGLKEHKAIIWPMSIVWVFMSDQAFKDVFSLYNFLKPEIFAPYGFALILGPLFLLWSAYGIRYFLRR